MAFCFFVKDYQDLDHFTPVINYLQGEKIFICLENKNLAKDKRIIFLKNSVELLIINDQNKILKRFKNYVFRFIHLEKCVFSLIKVASKIKIFKCFFYNHFLVKNNINVIIYDHRPPENCKFIFFSKFLNIKNISLPHGYHIFSDNIEFAESQSNRNIYDYYITQSNFQKKKLNFLGIHKKKIKVMGSPRFEKNWITELKKIYFLKKKLFNNKKIILSIFLGHWKYGINREKTLNLLRDILRLKKFNIILNLHTRGYSDLEKKELNSLKKIDNIIINNSKHHASVIINNSDIIIGVGTSVLMECITRRKIFFYLEYLEKYKTIFKDINYHQLPRSNYNMLKILQNFDMRKKNFYTYKSNDFYKKYIQNDIISLREEYKSFFRNLNCTI